MFMGWSQRILAGSRSCATTAPHKTNRPAETNLATVLRGTAAPEIKKFVLSADAFDQLIVRQIVKIVISYFPVAIPIAAPPQGNTLLVSNTHNITSEIIKTFSVVPVDRIRDHIDSQRR